MIFSPTLKRKRCVLLKTPTNPLPQYSPDQQPIGIFTGFSVEVNNPEHICSLYNSGCFGKGSKSRSTPKCVKPYSTDAQTESLVLDLEEAFLLTFYLNALTIEDINGKKLNFEELVSAFSNVKTNFVDYLVAYLYLRSKNWIVKSGTKFGGHFLVYKKGPRFYHASFIVFFNRGQTLQPRDVKGLQRIAETSDKDVLFLEINPPSEPEDILRNLHKFTVSENIIKRFNYSAFVQKK